MQSWFIETRLVLEESSAVKVLGSRGWPQGSKSGSPHSRGHSTAFYLPEKRSREHFIAFIYSLCFIYHKGIFLVHRCSRGWSLSKLKCGKELANLKMFFYPLEREKKNGVHAALLNCALSCCRVKRTPVGASGGPLHVVGRAPLSE